MLDYNIGPTKRIIKADVLLVTVAIMPNVGTQPWKEFSRW